MKSFFALCSIVLIVSLFASCRPKAPATETTDRADTTETIQSDNHNNGVPPPSGVKYGYLNSLQLLSIMPETDEADKKVAAYTKKKEAAFKSLVDRYQNRAKELQSKQADIPPVEMEKYGKELADLEEQIQNMQMRAESEIANEKDKLYAPILNKADSIVKQIGKENGYTFIYDAAALLYADSTLNLLPLVKERLGITK